MSVQRICADCSSLSRTSPCADCVDARERLARLQAPGAWDQRTDNDSDEYESN